MIPPHAETVRRAAFWDRRYLENDTPWDKGSSHPNIPVILQIASPLIAANQVCRLLVPGCGRGHDARELARHFQEVLAVDLSKEALQEARQHPENPENLRFVLADFLHPPEEWCGKTDVIFEHTCFCAIDPADRPAYAAACRQILRPGGLLAGLFFTRLPRDVGPPFGSPADELRETFAEGFALLHQAPVTQTFPGREGEEDFFLCQKQ
jgi:SAM-dependent methyltransferase